MRKTGGRSSGHEKTTSLNSVADAFRTACCGELPWYGWGEQKAIPPTSMDIIDLLSASKIILFLTYLLTT